MISKSITTAAITSASNNIGIPSEYKRVEYLESIAINKQGQYIDTEVLSHGSLGIEIKAQSISCTDNICFWFGGENSWSNGTSFDLQAGASGYGFIYGSQKSIGDTKAKFKNLNTPYILKIINGILSINNSFLSTYEILDFQSNTSVSLFGLKRNTTVPRCDSVRIWYCKFYEGENLINNFVPCLDENNNPCMYDLITKKTHYNLGIGSFITGPIL